ncbi:hypothetical protein H6F67_06585 [Microcoleus sp. FACHB-1515]|uniref:PD-(D/E)XK nuclease superfamily protein n=1 Tax=Cyanophyceae TaxID=3028117 RepID=UPI00168A061B|nr:PD-(D/E)XK nuclease superfamily protein [Microcoleus sp. FACHB-1515]MBD2089518.1 hypothetical protein [Microcoleus sp. FACHB-1515]
MSSGSRANLSGKTAEHILACILKHHGFVVKPQYIAGRSIYDCELKIDLFVEGIPAFPKGLAVESKWQDVKGSVDEKLPYLVTNIKSIYPFPAVIVIHGGGTRPGAIRWLKSQVDQDKLIAVLSLEEFVSWVTRKLTLAA